MSFSAYKNWAFGGISFIRVTSGDTDPRWFVAHTITSVDAVLGGTNRYVDIGGRDQDVLSLRIAVDSTTDRDALVAKLGTTGTLVAASDQTATALLTKAVVTVPNGSGLWFLDIDLVIL